MAETCIVCLGDLRTSVEAEPPPEAAEPAESAAEASNGGDAKRNTRSNTQSIESDPEAIAHLLPCKHELHNSCLTPWVERANSCPICRAKFNVVELSEVLRGPVISSFGVQDKLQEVDVDPTMVIEDELFAVEAWEPCLVCGAADDGPALMYCDGCDKAVHVFCAGHDDAPEIWYCEVCLDDLERDVGLPGMASAMRRRRNRTVRTAQPRPRQHNDRVWARVWQEVSRRLDLDLDFPFDEDVVDQRTEEQRREFERWQRRLNVASQQGATTRLREIANARLQPLEPMSAEAPESQEVLRAWNAFDKARELEDAPASVRRRKRKATASPEPADEEPLQLPPQKRPRLRRPPASYDQNHNSIAESSHLTASRPNEEPTFLSSLLREVESKPISAGSPGASDLPAGHHSPHDSSSDASSPSEPGTPRALSVTPPPNRPTSPPLSSTIVPISSPVNGTFSPFSPTDLTYKQARINTFQDRGRRRSHSPHEVDNEGPRDRASSSSPSRLSYSAKEEIQRMVKLALGSRYRDKEISKDQYTDINRDVSRKLYDLVGDVSALADQTGREKLQGIAEDEVKKAIAALSISDDG